MDQSDIDNDSPEQSSLKGAPFTLFRLQRYFRALLRYWWILVIFTGAGIVGIRYAAKFKEVVYTSSAKMLFKPNINIPGLTGNDVRFVDELYMAFSTEVEMLQSRMMQEKATQRLHSKEPNLEVRNISLSVKQSRDSSVIIIDATSPDPVVLPKFLDSLMEVYIASKKDVEVELSDATLATITDQLSRIEKQLQADEEELVAFRRTNNVVFLEEQGNSASHYLVNLNTQIASLKTEYQLLQMLDFEKNLAIGSANESKNDDKTSSGLATQMDYLKAKQQIAMKEVELTELSKFLRPVHPKIIALREEIDRQQHTLEILRNLSINQLSTRKESLNLQIKNLENTVREWEQRVLTASQGMAEYDRLKARMDRNKSLYNQLLNSMQSIDLSKRFKQDRVTVLEPASIPVAKFALRNNSVLGAFGGLVLGTLLIWLLHLLDDRFDSMLEFRAWFEEEVYGQIPRVHVKNGKAIFLDEDSKERHALHEAYRNLRSSLLYIPSSETKPKVLLVASSIPGEGKSTICANLAITIAASGARVLLIDADLRRGTQREMFGLPPGEPGLCEVLKQHSNWRQVVKPTRFEKLAVMPSGKEYEEGAELFMAPSLGVLINEARQEYDYIIFDSAPLMATDDTSALASKMDGVLFALRAGFTSCRSARNCLDQLHRRHARVLGIVINCLRSGGAIYGYHDYYNYKGYHRRKSPAMEKA